MAITKKLNLSELANSSLRNAATLDICVASMVPRSSIGFFAASIGLSRALERSFGVCDGFALGVLHRARCRLVMKLRLGRLWSRRPASPNLLLELRDLRRACPAMGSVAGACREGGAENNCSGKRNLCLAKHCRISWLSVLGHSAPTCDAERHSGSG
jgi:hypothetical protein